MEKETDQPSYKDICQEIYLRYKKHEELLKFITLQELRSLVNDDENIATLASIRHKKYDNYLSDQRERELFGGNSEETIFKFWEITEVEEEITNDQELDLDELEELIDYIELLFKIFYEKTDGKKITLLYRAQEKNLGWNRDNIKGIFSGINNMSVKDLLISMQVLYTINNVAYPARTGDSGISFATLDIAISYKEERSYTLWKRIPEEMEILAANINLADNSIKKPKFFILDHEINIIDISCITSTKVLVEEDLENLSCKSLDPM